MRKSIFLILVTTILNSVNGQDLNGKWLLKDIDSGNGHKGYPGFQLLEIKDSIAEFFTDFSLEKKLADLKIEKDVILTAKNGKFTKYKIVNENHLKLFMDGKSNGKDAVFESDFYRLVPTITKFKKEEIEKLTFLYIENERETELNFNKELFDKETLKILDQKEGHKNIIEQIDSTFFVSMYSNGKRSGSIAIKEVTAEFLKLYAIPSGPMEIIAHRKE